jgi:hypothetical protein
VDLRVERPQIEIRELSRGSSQTLTFQLVELVSCIRAQYTAVNAVLGPDTASTYDPDTGAGVVKDRKTGAFSKLTIDQVCVRS